jgi:hypothetical protein
MSRVGSCVEVLLPDAAMRLPMTDPADPESPRSQIPTE